MKKIVPVLALATAPYATAMEPIVGVEFLWGFGESSSNEGNNNSKFCKNRSWEGLKGFGVFVSKDNVEVNLAMYSHEDVKGCDRSNWAIGVGPKFSTRDNEEHKDAYAEWVPGISYRLNETWRDHGNLTLFNRLRVGTVLDHNVNDFQTSLEAGLLHFGGPFEPNHGETFLTLGLSFGELDNEFGKKPTAMSQGSGGSNSSSGGGNSSNKEPNNQNHVDNNSNSNSNDADSNTPVVTVENITNITNVTEVVVNSNSDSSSSSDSNHDHTHVVEEHHYHTSFEVPRGVPFRDGGFNPPGKNKD